MGGTAFGVRMMYAPSLELVHAAARLGCNWVVAGSTGHKGKCPQDDPPVLLPGYPRLPDRAARVAAERARLHGIFAAAKAAGLRVMLHSYEPSLPWGMQEAYPRLYSPEIAEYRRACAAVRRNRNLCVARPEVRAVLAAKVAELLREFPEVDAFSYTNNESNSTTKVWHRCDHCRDLPFPTTMRLLHEAVQEGVAQAGRPVRLVYRGWGATDHDHHYYEKFVEEVALGLDALPGQEWLPAHVSCFRPAKLHFLPSRDNPVFARYLAGQHGGVLLKASWADTNLHHPLNPWLGRYKPADEICEISFEYCRNAPATFHIMGREMQRRARHCRRLGIDGLAAVPISWGEQEDYPAPACSQPSTWNLGSANLDLIGALCQDPEADLQATTGAYLERRYGRRLPDELATLILDTEEVAAAMMNLNGIRATGADLRTFYNSLLRYGPMYPDWRRRTRMTAPNVARIAAAKIAAVRQAEGMVARIEALRPSLPSVAYDDFRLCFGNLLRQARQYSALHQRMANAIGLVQGVLPADPLRLHQLMELAGRDFREAE